MVSRHRSTARDPVTTSGGTSRSVHGLCQRHCGDLRMAADCEYVRDPVHERDYWQHPKTFEQLRKGDCEDHALWAWRKLTELGLPAEFYVGRWRTGKEAQPGFHAWVVFQDGGIQYLLEATGSSRETIVRRLDDVRGDYFPHFA